MSIYALMCTECALVHPTEFASYILTRRFPQVVRGTVIYGRYSHKY